MAIPRLFRRDGWKNVLSGLGTRKDKSSFGSVVDVVPFPRLTDVQLQSLYYTDGVVKNSVNVVAEKMVQKGFEVEGDDGSLYKAFQDLDGPQKIEQALKWTRMLGGAVIVLDVEGGGDWSTPWKPESGGRIRSLRVYPRTRVELGMMEAVALPESAYFEDYEVYVIRTASGNTFKVHASRVITLKSSTCVDAAFPGWLDYERFWGLSSIYEGLTEVRNFGMTQQGISHLVQECSIGKFRLSNLESLISENDWKSIGVRMEAIDEQKSIINSVLLGEGEEYTRENVSFAGLPEIWDRQAMGVSGSYRVPVTLLFGRSAAGMNATGEGDDDNFNSYVAGLQEIQLKPAILRLMTLLNYELKAVNTQDDSLTVNFSPLSSRDKLKDAQVRETQSRTDLNYIDSGVLSRDEVRKNRFVGGYSEDTAVEDEEINDLDGDGGDEG